MKALHARYPFLEAAKAAVEEADADLATVVREEAPVVERAADRVRHAVEDGSIGHAHPTTRVELLSYPVARVLVSLVGDPALVRRYAEAEAATAIERFLADEEDTAELRSVSRERLSREDLLREFDLDVAVSAEAAVSAGGAVSDGETGPGEQGSPGERGVPGEEPVTGEANREAREERAWIGVADYLALASSLDGARWRLANRALANGRVAVSDPELTDLLREAVRRRVESGLPLDVPPSVADAVSDVVADLRDRLADVEIAGDFAAVVPDLFPPCVDALLERARSGESLPAHSRYALVSFLAALGLDADEVVALVGSGSSIDSGTAQYQVAHVRGARGTGTYPPPSCATMQAYGDCVNMDDLCETISHPLTYYGRRLESAADPTDWREREGSDA